MNQKVENVTLKNYSVALHSLRNDGGAAGDNDGNTPNDEMRVAVAQVMENDGNSAAISILEIAVLVSWAAVSPRKMTGPALST